MADAVGDGGGWAGASTLGPGHAAVGPNPQTAHRVAI